MQPGGEDARGNLYGAAAFEADRDGEEGKQDVASEQPFDAPLPNSLAVGGGPKVDGGARGDIVSARDDRRRGQTECAVSRLRVGIGGVGRFPQPSMVIVTVDGAVDVTSGGHPGPVRVEAVLHRATVGDNCCRRRRDWPSRPLPLTGLTPTLSRVPRGRGRWSTRCREGRHEGGRAEARWCRRGKSRPEQAGSLGHGQGGVVGRAE